MTYEFMYALDLFPLLAAVLAAMTCGLLGNFLVLRKQSLMGDAISHAVLPGLVVAFLVTSSRSPMIMFAGAAIAGAATVVLIELVKKLGRVEPGAAMGVVFSVLFAFGVLLIEKAAARHVDLDADCVLYGQLETLAEFGLPDTFAELWSLSTLEMVPRQVWMLAVMFTLAVLFVAFLFKELRIAAFDPGLATTQGIHAGVMHYALMIFVAAATVASFEAVGSILVIAMLVCPAATARLLTDRLGSQVACSLIAALACGVLGYFGATMVPLMLGSENSVNAAGSMTLVAGGLVGLAAFFSPSHGLIARAWRRRGLARETAIDDLLASLMRLRETGSLPALVSHLRSRPGLPSVATAIKLATGKGLVKLNNAAISLTEPGLQHATAVLRKHRLWESYLVKDAGLRADHVHDVAEKFEHVDIEPKIDATTDPHGKPIYPAPK